MDLTALTARTNTLFGFDLSSSEAADLLNQGRREAARRSRYPKKSKVIGETVAEQAAYEYPSDLLLVESVYVEGTPYSAADREKVRQFEKGSPRLLDPGVWYDGTDESGDRKLTLYPVPSAGQGIELEWVYEGTPFNTSEPNAEPDELPEWFHPHLTYFVGEIYYDSVEDNPELAEAQRAKADAKVSDLIRYDNERQAGNGIFMPGIVGQSA